MRRIQLLRDIACLSPVKHCVFRSGGPLPFIPGRMRCLEACVRTEVSSTAVGKKHLARTGPHLRLPSFHLFFFSSSSYSQPHEALFYFLYKKLWRLLRLRLLVTGCKRSTRSVINRAYFLQLFTLTTLSFSKK